MSHRQVMIDDRYEVDGLIGAGGMSTVWIATDRLLGRRVAIKRLLPHLAADEAAARRFSREARAAARLSHPGIVTLYDTGSDAEGPYLVLELVDGRNLADILAGEGAFDPGTSAVLLQQAAAAIDHAHGLGVIHRDIKPSNLILDAQGQLRLTDFGIASVLGETATLTDGDGLIGTVTYMAPEVLDGQPATPASDIYSLGAVAHEMLTGRKPFSAGSVGSMIAAIKSGDRAPLDEVDPEIAIAIDRALSLDPALRPGTAGEFAAGMVAGATVPIDPQAVEAAPTERSTVVSVAPDTSDVDGTRPRWALFATGAVLVAGALLVIGAMLNRIDSPAAVSPLAGTTTTADVVTTSTTAAAVTKSTVTPIEVETPEQVAGEIRSLLAAMRPPEFKPKETKKVSEALDDVMGSWAEGEADELEEGFEEKLLGAIEKLEESPERAELVSAITRLAESMGYEISAPPDDDR